MRAHLDISEQRVDDSVRLLVLRGPLDHTTAAGLVVKVKCGVSARRPGVIVDLTDVTSVDAAAVKLLHDSRLRLAGAEGCLALVSRERQLQLSPESHRLEVFRSRAEAVAAVHRVVCGRPRAVRSVLDVPPG